MLGVSAERKSRLTLDQRQDLAEQEIAVARRQPVVLEAALRRSRILNKFLEGWAGAVLAKIAVLVFIIIFIQKRPQGIFAMKGRSAEA